MIEALDTLEEVLKANLKALRGKESQEAFAKRANIPHPTYRDAENGSIPQEKTLTKIAAAHGIPKMALFLDPDLRGFSFVKKPTPEEALEVLREALTLSLAKRRLLSAAASLDDSQVLHYADLMDAESAGSRGEPLPKPVNAPMKPRKPTRGAG